MNALGWTQGDLVRASGLSKGNASEILNEKRGITPKAALALQRAFGEDASYWLILQAKWSLKKKREQPSNSR